MKLSYQQRKKLSPKTFIFPKDRSYPIPDISHARNALARSSGKAEASRVRSAVYKKYPSLKHHAAVLKGLE